jgi:threonine dehydratase
LLAGTALAAEGQCNVFGAEPKGADDAYRGLKSGVRVTDQTPMTVADGLRTCLGVLNFEIIRDRVEGIGLAEEDEIVSAMNLVHTRMKQLIETSSAVPLACLLNGSIPSSGRIGIILSGGNVDLSTSF